MSAKHDHFVLETRVGARNLGDDVVAARVGREIASLNVDANCHGDAVLQKANDVVVILPANDDRRHAVRSGVTRLKKQRAVFAAARLQYRTDTRVVEDRCNALRFGRTAASSTRAPTRAAGTAAGLRQWCVNV